MQIGAINGYSVYSQGYSGIKKQNISNSINFKSNPQKTFTTNKIKEIYQYYKGMIKKSLIFSIFLGGALGLNNAGSDFKNSQSFVEPQQEKFETKNQAIDYAISRIIVPLNQQDSYEYSVLLDYQDYSVISEAKGKSHSVTNYPLEFLFKDKLKIKHPYISLHGHPDESFHDRLATQTFSFQDFRSFNFNENEKESFVVNKNGKFCMLRKKEGFRQIPEEEMIKLEKRFYESFQTAWANPVEVYKNDVVVKTFYDYQGMHAFWKQVADEHNIEYYTNYGVFDGEDAYSDYYYPELKIPQAPTSHRNFKL